MASALARNTDRVLAALPGWMLLLSGAALLAMSLVVPIYLEVRDLAWRRDVMLTQAQSMEQQRIRYEQFLSALEDEDPVLLGRLAYTQWRFKPAEAELVASPIDGPIADASVAAWLAQPMPELPASPPTLSTRLTRLTSHDRRKGLFAVAVICLVAGLMWRPRLDPHWQAIET